MFEGIICHFVGCLVTSLYLLTWGSEGILVFISWFCMLVNAFLNRYICIIDVNGQFHEVLFVKIVVHYTSILTLYLLGLDGLDLSEQIVLQLHM